MKILKRILIGLGALVGLCILALAVPVYLYFPGHHFRTVEENVFYGSRQMSGPALEKYIHKYGIKTVLNCRGENAGSDWYDAEVAACQKAGVAHFDFGWSKNNLPDPESLARFVDTLDTATPPFLVHCEGGTHRTGVAAACYLLCKGKDIPTARKQFGFMFNDAPIGKLLDLYALQPIPFRQWVKEVYPDSYAAYKQAP